MNKNKILPLILLVLSGLHFTSCEKELDKPALGAISEDQLRNKRGVEALLIGAYAALDNNKSTYESVGGDVFGFMGGSPSNWAFGSIGGGEAHFGAQGSEIQLTSWNVDPSHPIPSQAWKSYYEGVSRANAVLKLSGQAPDISEQERKLYDAQARFIRGHFYFYLKKAFNNVPWIDESTTNFIQPNNEDIWPKIEADFKFAMEFLPGTQAEIGRVNKWAAASYLGKTYLYQKKWNLAKDVFDDVIANGKTSKGEKYNLEPRYHDNFNATTENNSETIFQVQMNASDGTNSLANANGSELINFPFHTPFNCCGAFRPSQDLVNSYRTDAQGLPLLDNYNQNPVKDDIGVGSTAAFNPDMGNLDPRLDWTVARRGVPVHDWGIHPGSTWTPDQLLLGPYASKKILYWQYNRASTANETMFFRGTSINVNIIRFADVLLMAAEAEAQMGNLNQAEEYVNRVRLRAANPAGFLYDYVNNSQPLVGFSNNPAANYAIKPYPSGSFVSQGRDYALKAIYFERKLELALEGHRFFDLSRWGIADQFMNQYFQYERTKINDVSGANFIKGKNEYFPIPQVQIDLMINAKGEKVLKQNPGYQ